MVDVGVMANSDNASLRAREMEEQLVVPSGVKALLGATKHQDLTEFINVEECHVWLLACAPMHCLMCVELLGVSQLASKISLIRPEMAVFLTKCSKKREGAFHN